MSLKDRISVSIHSPAPVDKETESELQQFSWDIVSVSPEKMKIDLKFDFPESVSVDLYNPQSAWVKAKFSDFEPGWVDDLVIAAIELPK